MSGVGTSRGRRTIHRRWSIRLRRWRGRSAAAWSDLVYPPRCVVCDRETERGGEAFCAACRAALLGDARPACRRCGSRVRLLTGPLECPLCRGARFGFRRAVALGNYEGPLRDAVYQLKRRGQEPLAYQLGRCLGRRVRGELGPERCQLVAPVSSPWWRQWRRGMNPAAVIAEGVAAAARMPCEVTLLRHTRRTKKQGMLTRQERLLNVQQALRVARRFEIGGLSILLVDDVMASGATANEAARALRAAGAAAVYVAVIARGTGGAPG